MKTKYQLLLLLSIVFSQMLTSTNSIADILNVGGGYLITDQRRSVIVIPTSTSIAAGVFVASTEESYTPQTLDLEKLEANSQSLFIGFQDARPNKIALGEKSYQVLGSFTVSLPKNGPTISYDYNTNYLVVSQVMQDESENVIAFIGGLVIFARSGKSLTSQIGAERYNGILKGYSLEEGMIVFNGKETNSIGAALGVKDSKCEDPAAEFLPQSLVEKLTKLKSSSEQIQLISAGLKNQDKLSSQIDRSVILRRNKDKMLLYDPTGERFFQLSPLSLVLEGRTVCILKEVKM